MTPPPVWIETYLAQNLEGPVYPFIYPPLWAWVMSFVTGLTDFVSFAQAAYWSNIAMLIGSLVLALRIVRPGRGHLVYLAIGALIFIQALSTRLALEENQPQILVSFLILLGVERARNGHQVFGGIAMALAASIKIYPVVFALFWLAGGKRPATVSFAIAGAVLGLLSITVAGWSMHAAFLHELAVISRTILLSLANFSLDSALAAILYDPSEMVAVNTSVTGGQTNWFVIGKSPTWRLFSIALQLLTLLALLALARRDRLEDPLFWPVAILAVALVSPLSWIYHYLTAIVFLPALALRLGTRRGVILIALIAAPSSILIYIFDLQRSIPPNVIILLNVGALFLAFIVFLTLLLSGRRNTAT